MLNPDKHLHAKIKLAVSGAAETAHCGEGATEAALLLGREIARQGAVLVTGATTGIPLWASRGCKEEGGTVIGLSPAKGEKEHVEEYKLPLDYMDFIVYTGQGYPGRDLLMTRTADAIVIGCGRVGTIHEFTIAFEDNKPIGIMAGPHATDEVIQMILKESNRAEDNKKIVYDDNPKRLVEKVLELVKKDKEAVEDH